MSDDLWYKDAIFYELHVKAYSDANGDGMGDFPGLLTRLDHLKDLGVDCVWLLPMYPSPFRDDGYDISDYCAIHPQYGTLDDFRAFLAAAHDAGPPGHHRARDQPHLRPAPLVQGGPLLPGQPEARLLRLERHRRPLPRRADHLPRHRDVELGLGPRLQGLLLAPLLLPPARPQLRQPRGARGDLAGDAVLARARRGRVPGGRGALPRGAGGHLLREPARDPRGRAGAAAEDGRGVPGADAPRRGQHVAGGRAALLRGRRRLPHGLPLPAHAPHVHGPAARGPEAPRRDRGAHAGDPRHLPVGPLPPQPRRADPRDGDGRRARLHVRRSTRATRWPGSTWGSAAGSRRSSTATAAASSS